MLKTVVVFLTWPPSHIWIISAAFGVLFLVALILKIHYSRIWTIPSLIICVMWCAFGIYQSNPNLQSYNIRIDLVFIIPLLFGGTLSLVLFQLWSLVRTVRTTKR